MGKGKHTPGPWRFEWDGDEAVILGRPTWPCERHSVRGEWQVAVTDDLLCEKPEEAEANARLIAAAPDLLEALIAAANSAGFQYMTAETRDLIDSVIAKAEDQP